MKILKILMCIFISLSNLNIGNEIEVQKTNDNIFITVEISDDISFSERLIVVIKRLFYAFYRFYREINIFTNRFIKQFEIEFIQL